MEVPGGRRAAAAGAVAILLALLGGVVATTGGRSSPPLPLGEPGPFPDADVNERLGLHVTSAELDEWRARARRGPYRTAGDVSENSPGDWERIEEHAGRFLDDPAAGRWTGPVENNPGGCVRRDGGRAGDPGWQPPVREPSDLRDAAFVALVARDRQVALAVKDELLAQAAVDGVDFGDRRRWCPGRVLDGSPGFTIATWLTKLLYATDYVEVLDAELADAELLTSDERDRLDGWFRDAAEWMREDTDRKLDELFADRRAGDYRLTATARSEPRQRRPVFWDGPEVQTLHRRFNNRNARQARFVTLVGTRVGDSGFIEHGKSYVRDALRFTYFPSGAVGDFERWTDDDPIRGWKYGCELAGALLTIADHLARAGDTSLYRFATTDGALGTEGAHADGGPKTLETLAVDLLRYVDGTYERYGTDRRRRADDPRYLIDSVNELDGEARINDTQLAQGARWFENAYVDDVIARRRPGAPPYPADPTRGAGDPEGGEAGVFPGILFMFAGVDVDVYP